MTLQNLNQAIQECNIGALNFNLGNVRAFLFENKWYPLRATINRASELANENNEFTTDRALVQLVYLDAWTRIEDVTFNDHFPITLNNNDKLIEANKLAKIVLRLTN